MVEDNQFLTFFSNEEVFGIRILQVKEIKEYSEVTSIPLMPEFVKGVINLRGNVVPIIDLPIRFGREKTVITKRTCIIILEVFHESESLDIGILVDAVSEVIEIPESMIEPTPSFGSKIRNDFIMGIGKLEQRFAILLDINKVLSVGELSMIEETMQTETSNIS
jgi:purine-binding chemotaxis protein CheW